MVETTRAPYNYASDNPANRFDPSDLSTNNVCHNLKKNARRMKKKNVLARRKGNGNRKTARTGRNSL
jgi:hypothetical protein